MNPSQLATTTFGSRIDDARRRADASGRAAEARSARRGRTSRADGYAEQVTIRSAGPADRAALDWLAEVDSGRAPAGETLVAEVRGDIVAAIGLRDGAIVANPFRRTADLLTLLRLRRTQLDG